MIPGHMLKHAHTSELEARSRKSSGTGNGMRTVFDGDVTSRFSSFGVISRAKETGQSYSHRI